MSNLEPRISKYLHLKAAKNRIPLAGTFELSPCCNLNCKMCYVRKSKKEVEELGGEIDVDKWLKLAKDCKDAGMLFLLLTGGEPFLYKGFKELYLELLKMGFAITINTNGTLIDEEVMEWLVKSPPFRINMTLYGASSETYNKLCGSPSSFDKTLKAAKLLKNAGISVKFNASMTPYNIEDLDKLYEIAEDLNIYIQATSYMFPPIRRNKDMIGCGNRFNAKDAAYYSVKIDKHRLTQGQFIERAKSMKNNILIHEEDNEMVDIELEGLKCRAGKSCFWINWKGEMSPCGMMNTPVSYPFKDGFIKAWYEIVEKTKKITMPIKCTKCKKRPICNVCGASVAAETGGYIQEPKYICEMTDNILEQTQQEYESLKELDI